MTITETVFLTGFPGFIAGRLLERLARTAGRFFLLVQPAFAEAARLQVNRIAQKTGRTTKDFQIVQGDISQHNFGMAAAELQSVLSETTTLFHLAAIYDLAVPRDLAFRINVEGTKHINKLALSLKRLRHYHYVSTCYVAGKREGRILETELNHQAGFRNYYEESKYLAEVEVDRLKSELPVTIHRPAVVCGDSKTGETVKYDGVYYLILYLLRWPRVLSAFNIGNREVSLNLVPVDFVVDAMTALTMEERAVGKTVQLADPDPLSTYELFNAIARSINGKGSVIRVPARLVEFSLKLPPSPRITGLPHHGVPYFFLRQTYDTKQSKELLAPHGISCPPFPSYVNRIVEYVAKQW